MLFNFSAMSTVYVVNNIQLNKKDTTAIVKTLFRDPTKYFKFGNNENQSEQLLLDDKYYISMHKINAPFSSDCMYVKCIAKNPIEQVIRIRFRYKNQRQPPLKEMFEYFGIKHKPLSSNVLA